MNLLREKVKNRLFHAIKNILELIDVFTREDADYIFSKRFGV